VVAAGAALVAARAAPVPRSPFDGVEQAVRSRTATHGRVRTQLVMPV
jgi:hypothetical protein